MRPVTPRPVLINMALALSSAALLLAAIAFKPSPLFIWNASDSVPIGLYWVRKNQPEIGEIAVIAPPDWVQQFASSRGYLPSNVWLLKPVFASSNSVACRFGTHVFVRGKHVARARIYDREKRILPAWKGCRALRFDEIFVLAKPKDSFDSRYFGPVGRDQVAGTAAPLFIP